MPPRNPHREDWPLPLRGRWLRYCGIGVMILSSPLWMCVAPLWLADQLLNPPVRDPASLRSFFSLPESATILSGQYQGRLSLALGEDGYVRFTLPNTRTPDQWIAMIAKDALGKHAASARKSATEYDAYNGAEGYRIKFLRIDFRGRRIYEAEAGWD